MRSCWHSAGERSAQRWRRGGELTHKRRKAPGADTRGPPGWEPDLRWRGWGAEIPPPEPSVLARSCSVAGGVKKRLTRWRSEPDTDHDRFCMKRFGRTRRQQLVAGLLEQDKPPVEQLRPDPLDPQVGAERVALVTPGLQHHAGPEIPDHREVRRPGPVGDGAGEHGSEQRITPDLGVECVHDGRYVVLSESGGF